ncbi:DUF4391 domain-containing protein [Microbacterium paludicola]|uniref:DUF4391 domain-containing protein n=1 Tax=Microbacterium paludicola TaxID=300019 RepID=UPI0031D1CA23
MTDVLYAWPAAAAFGRRVPKEKLYAHGSVTAAVRERFVDEVASVEWAYKLAESTVNLAGDGQMPEVQIFRVVAKGDDVSPAVLAAIDKAVLTPIVFEIARGDKETRMAASVQKTAAFHSTGWMPSDRERTPLPAAITLSALHAAIIEPLLPIAGRAAESPADLAARLKRVTQLERQVAAAERRLRNEPQLNRKLELRRALAALRAELEAQR